MEITQAIFKVMNYHRGAANSIERRELLNRIHYWTGSQLSDRAMREAIEDLRTNTKEGAYICHSPDGHGYFLATTPQELRDYLLTERKRGISILKRVSQQAKRAGVALEGQLELTL